MSYPTYLPTIGNDLGDLLDEELSKAIKKHPDFPSIHHGIAVIREEYIELEQECFKQSVSKELIKKEAVHLAVTCLRLIKSL